MTILTDGPTVILSGDIDVRSTDEVRRAVYAALNGYDGDIVVDLSAVENVDLTALRLLAVASRQASRTGQHLRLRGCGPGVRRLLHISHLIRVLDVERVAASA